jgi:DNA recombination-dependent growth factor C
MPFDRGTFTCSMFELSGEIPENFAEIFAAAKAGTLDSVTADPQFGWVTGHHLLDTAIDSASAQQGGCYCLTLRQAVRKIPASLLNALCRREEQAFLAANPGREYVSGKDKKRIKEEVTERYITKMPPALSGITMVLDPNTKLLYLGAGSQSQIDLFIEHFYRLTKLEPLQLTPASILDKEFHTTCAAFPALNLTDVPGMPMEPTVGRDFLTWLFYYSETVGKLPFENNEFDVMLEAPLVLLDDAEARGAGETVVKKGDSPLRGAEVKAALSVGKKLKKVKLTLTRDDDSIWTSSFDADTFVFGSFKLPEGEEMNPDEIFADRMRELATFRAVFIEYFKLFANAMLNEPEKTRNAMREWMQQREAI